MKRILFVLLVLIEVHCVVAQTTIVCNAEGELPRLLEEKARHKTALIISGPLNAEDIKALNSYPQIEYLNFRDALLSTVPEYAWNNLSVLRQVDLPLGIDTLNLNAFSYQEEICLILTGNFPYLKNQPKDTYGIPLPSFPEFVVEESNTKLSYMDYAYGVGIYSADRKTLYKSFLPYGAGDVEEVMPYAYLNVSAGDYVCIGFGERLKRIANNAFAGFEYKGISLHEGKSGFYVQFMGATPPEKFGEGNLNIGYTYPWDYEYNPMVVVVPDKDKYIEHDNSWGDLWLINERDWKSNSIENVYINSSTPYYDLMGRPVANPMRGIYIKDGKKMAVD